MFRLVLASFALSFLLKDAHCYCCFNIREPLVYNPPCGCTGPTPVGVVNCGQTPTCTGCDNPAASDFSLCKCSIPTSCNCFKDTTNVCAQCESNQSPLCSCLSSLTSDTPSCNCGSGGKSIVYYPEVQYPITIAELNPNYYYSTCFSY